MTKQHNDPTPAQTKKYVMSDEAKAGEIVTAFSDIPTSGCTDIDSEGEITQVCISFIPEKMKEVFDQLLAAKVSSGLESLWTDASDFVHIDFTGPCGEEVVPCGRVETMQLSACGHFYYLSRCKYSEADFIKIECFLFNEA